MNFHYLISSYLALFVLGLIDMARGPIYPQILRDFSVGTAEGSYFFTVASFSGLLINLASRWWLSRWGAFRSLQVFTVLQGLGCVGMGWSGSVENGFLWLLVSSFAFGVSLGGTGIVINLLVVDGGPERLHGKLLSGLHTMYGMAALLAPFLVQWISADGGNWQQAFYWMALGPLFLLLQTFFFSGGGQRPKLSKTGLHRSRLSRRAWWMVLAISFYVGAEMVLSTRLVVYLQHELGWSAQSSSLQLSLFFLGLMLGRLAGSLLSRPNWEIELIAGAGVASLLCFVGGLWGSPWALSLCGLTMALVFPTLVSVTARELKSEAERVVSVGLTGVGFVLIVVHWSFGRLAEAVGLREALLIGPIFLALMLLFFWCFCRRGVDADVEVGR